jgi:hypothetical protein
MRNASGFIVGCALLCVSASAADLQFTIRVIADKPATAASLESEDGSRQAFVRDAATGRFVGTLDQGALASALIGSKIVGEYRVVVQWADTTSEQLYLGLRLPAPQQLDVGFYRDQAAFDVAALDAIDKLGTDIESTFQKFFRARAFHRYWHFDQNNPDYWLALRSARIWFDAAARLAQLRNSPFRMDPDIVEVMRQYEEKATRDASFRRRFRQYANEGYVQATVAQTQAADYAFIGQIAELRVAGRMDEARALNHKAIAALSAESADVQKAVLQNQRVDLKLLTRNAAALQAQ